ADVLTLRLAVEPDVLEAPPLWMLFVWMVKFLTQGARSRRPLVRTGDVRLEPPVALPAISRRFRARRQCYDWPGSRLRVYAPVWRLTGRWMTRSRCWRSLRTKGPPGISFATWSRPTSPAARCKA